MTPFRERRVVVTGVGVVCSWGWGRERLWSGLCGGKTSIGPFRRFDHGDYLTHIAAEAPVGDTDRRDRRLSLADRFALFAAHEALEQAGLPRLLSELRAGVFFGSSTGGMFESEQFYRELRASPRRAGARVFATQQLNAPGDEVARRLRVSGPVETVSSACSSATLAIGLGLEAVRTSVVDLALVGGSDSLCRLTYGGFNALRSVDPLPCRPFRSQRQGLSLGEGSAVLVLEAADSAERRGAVALATLCGSGASCDAQHMTAPDPEGRGAAMAIASALADAGLSAEHIDFINSHGTGTPLNDVAEYRAFRRVFEQRTDEIPVSATKASVGHLLGSAGALEAAATVLSLERQFLPPDSASGPIDPETPVRLRSGAPPGSPLTVGLSLNLAFGGCNAALVFARVSDIA